MARPPGGSGSDEPSDIGASPDAGPAQADGLVTLLELCMEAQAVAESRGEKLLSYILAMAVEETRNAIRKSSALMHQHD